MNPRAPLLLLALSLGLACSKASSSQAPELPPPGPETPLVRCVPGDGPLAQRSMEELERLALDAEEEGAFATMLACAQEALRLDEESGWAAHLRGEALAHLGLLDAAQEAFTVALALAPDDPYLLAGIGELYANKLPPSRERSLAAVHFAKRGLALTEDVELRRRLHLIVAWGEADRGRFGPSLRHGQRARRIDQRDPDAMLAIGRALFELTRFEEAAMALEEVLALQPDAAEVHFLLGLSLEWLQGREEEAEAALRKAAALDPNRYPLALRMSDEALGRMVAREVERLPKRERALLDEGGVPILLHALPDLADLRAEDPPLSPTALGMFRGMPIGTVDGPREILLYGKNLRRAARTEAELREQVRITLRHEVGHLAGEDEADLRARGLD